VECYFFAGAGGTGVPLCGALFVGIGSGTVTPLGCAGAGTGSGADFAGALVFGALSSTDVPNPAFLLATIESDSDVNINRIADSVVAFDNSVADPRGPKAVCDPIPPNAPARSAALPLCSRTTMIRNRHTIT